MKCASREIILASLKTLFSIDGNFINSIPNLSNLNLMDIQMSPFLDRY